MREQVHKASFAHAPTAIPKLKTFNVQSGVLFLAVVYNLLFFVVR